MSDALESLSKRERQIMLLAAKGLTDAGIAQKLEISSATVGTYWGRIRTKLGHHSRTELVANYMREKAAATLDEMRKQNEALQVELELKSKTADQARGKAELLRRVLSAAPDAILLVSEDGLIEYANEEAERLFGYGAHELANHPVSLLVPPRFHGLHSHHRARYLAEPTKRKMGDHYGTPAVRKDGTEFLTATTLSAMKTPQGQVVTVFVRELADANILNGSEPSAS
jgi:PAS domain S-box-containing protein